MIVREDQDPSIAEISVVIRDLEDRLLQGRDRHAAAEGLLAADFVEIGASGRLWRREEVVRALKASDGSECRVNDFSVRAITAELLLATYRATRNREGVEATSLRSSL